MPIYIHMQVLPISEFERSRYSAAGNGPLHFDRRNCWKNNETQVDHLISLKAYQNLHSLWNNGNKIHAHATGITCYDI